ncbi:hypothetical protein M514_10512 [Trichuris suis]|uniref:Uncharacterized protein n=1 Tax=Trichuris suis TaxID=68888 RepID=A0A085LUD2_9BILA|nr:hypothetical protein M513_10512 [Trichuris suis]KFD63965.1 hypothetical protein M514_10512 [Trichuris suis]
MVGVFRTVNLIYHIITKEAMRRKAITAREAASPLTTEFLPDRRSQPTRWVTVAKPLLKQLGELHDWISVA